MQNPV